jgi:hypothetical protein
VRSSSTRERVFAFVPSAPRMRRDERNLDAGVVSILFERRAVAD